MSDLEGLRRQIDRVDDQLIELLARRFELCRTVAQHKRALGIPAVLPDRIEEVKARCGRQAENRAVSADFVRALYTMIIEEACRIELEIMAAAPDR
jgi:chorismate mutase-like protein